MAKQMVVVLYKDKIDKMLNHPNGMMGRHLSKQAKKVQAAAKRQVGVNSGRLKRSIRVYGHKRTATGQELFIGSAVPYARMHHEGTKRHRISAKKRSYLKFRSGSVLTYRRSVNHPGTKPNRYLSDNLYLFYS
jgi:phage gpG-like protein